MPLRETIQLARPLRDARAIIAAFPGVSPAAFYNATTEPAAYERGRQEGEKALSEQLMRQRGELIELQNGVIKSLKGSITNVTAECEGAMVALALEIAGKLVGDLPISSEMVEAAVREALASVEQKGMLTVLLNPMDFELLQQIKDRKSTRLNSSHIPLSRMPSSA